MFVSLQKIYRSKMGNRRFQCIHVLRNRLGFKLHSICLSLLSLGLVQGALVQGATVIVEVEEGGPCHTPAAYTDVPTVAHGNLARLPDAVAFSSPAFITLPIENPRFKTSSGGSGCLRRSPISIEYTSLIDLRGLMSHYHKRTIDLSCKVPPD